MDIREVLARRDDLSTFLVHLSKDLEGASAKANLESILQSGKIEARSPFGHALRILSRRPAPHKVAEMDTQKCVCFTETPLQFISLLLERIDKRKYAFKPYGIALPKKVGRRKGVNPVWYIDTTPGRRWLTTNIDTLIRRETGANAFPTSEIAKLTPFIERMGTGPGFRMEFWWEREWRHHGDFDVPERVIVLCPEDEIDYFRRHLAAVNPQIAGSFIDPRWSLEKMISYLAGFQPNDVDIF